MGSVKGRNASSNELKAEHGTIRAYTHVHADSPDLLQHCLAMRATCPYSSDEFMHRASDRDRQDMRISLDVTRLGNGRDSAHMRMAGVHDGRGILHVCAGLATRVNPSKVPAQIVRPRCGLCSGKPGLQGMVVSISDLSDLYQCSLEPSQ